MILLSFFPNVKHLLYNEYQFERRLGALQQYLAYLNDDSIRLILDRYDNEGYMKELSDLKEEPEGGRRCRICYRKRMEETFRYAKKHHYDYCTTVMSISNRKNADWLNEIGEELEKKYPDVTYLHADFKKGDGIMKNDLLNKELGLYHQDYCGCIYSIRKENDE